MLSDKPLKIKALPLQLLEIEGGVILKRGCKQVKIAGENSAEFLRHLLAATGNGGATREQILATFAHGDKDVIMKLLQQLLDRQLLVPTEEAVNPADIESTSDIFYWHFGKTAADISKRLNKVQITVLGVNYISRHLLASLRKSGLLNLQLVDDPLLRNLRLFDDRGHLDPNQWGPEQNLPIECEKWLSSLNPQIIDCLVVSSDFGNSQVMRKWNNFCVQNQRRFFPVVLHNLIGYVGPFVIPGETACFECLRLRQNSHLHEPNIQRAAEEVAFEGQVVIGFHPLMTSILGDITAFELVKFYSGVLPRQVGTLIEINLLDSRMTTRKLLKVPRCSVCSPLKTRQSINPNKLPASSTDETPK